MGGPIGDNSIWATENGRQGKWAEEKCVRSIWPSEPFGKEEKKNADVVVMVEITEL